MTGVRPFVEHAADVLGRGVAFVLVVIGAGFAVLIVGEAVSRWLGRP